MVRYKPPATLTTLLIFIVIIPSINLEAAQSEEKVVLVTGFEPFGGYDVNPSELIAEDLNGTTIDGVKIVGISLEVEWNISYNKTLELIERYDPCAVVSIGLAPKSSIIRLEKLAVNLRWDECFPFVRLIQKGSPFLLATDVNLHEISVDMKKENISSRVSYFAGFYLCNYLFYRLLDYKEKNDPELKVVFIHVPPLDEMNLQEMTDGVKIAITHLIRNG